jgi:hypothetical protein
MYDYNKKIVLKINALDYAFENMLFQSSDNGVLWLMAYFSAKHTAAKCNYEIKNKKLLAIIKCLKEWRPEL